MSRVVQRFMGDGGARAAMERQRTAVRDERNRLAAVEAGQRRLNRGGSFLGYVDEQLSNVLGG